MYDVIFKQLNIFNHSDHNYQQETDSNYDNKAIQKVYWGANENILKKIKTN